MARPIKKAVFPVAGLGTRFLPTTKAMPQGHAASEAGTEHFILVTGRNESVIEDHRLVYPLAHSGF